MNRGFNTVHIGHDDVADDQVGAIAPCAFNGSGARINGRGVKSRFIQNDGQGVGNDTFVIDDEYLRLGDLCFHATLDWMLKLASMLLRFDELILLTT